MNMIITKITIENFKIFKYHEFAFGENKVILLTGANGFGKTTLIDAIEWCFTGDIARIKKCYGERNSTQTEKDRTENKNGIIKNSTSKPDDVIKVMITLKIDNEEVNIYREQKEDNLYIKTELKYVGDIPPEIKAKIEKFTSNDNFYNYHICDIYKSHNFLNSGRKEIKKHFEDFIKPHPRADSFSQKLDELHAKILEKVSVLENEKIPQEKFDAVKNEIDSLKADSKIIDYPQVEFYGGENLSVEKENIDSVREQLGHIKECGYSTIETKIGDIILYYEAKDKIKKIDEIIEIIKCKESDINFVIKNSYHETEKLEEIKSNIRVITAEKTKVENAKKLLEINTSSTPELYSEIANDIKIHSDAVTEIEDALFHQQKEIKNREKGNEIIAALSNLVVSKDGVYKYKIEGNEQCPLCGSDQKFSKILEAREIAVDAEAYLEKNNSELVGMKKNEQESIGNLNTTFDQFKQLIIKHLNKKILTLEEQKVTFLKHYENTKSFFEKLKKLNIPINPNSIATVQEKKTQLNKALSNETSVNSNLAIIRKILTVLDYKADFDNIDVDSLKKIQIEMKQLCNKALLVSNFTFELFNQKLLFINNILNNHRIGEKELVIKKYTDDNIAINKKIKEFNTWKDKAKRIRDEIEKKKAEIEKLELEAVGPYLFRIFTKVIKHTKITRFNFVRDSSRVAGGATFTDQNNNNIFNILSQGQLGVFMLAYFFANMFKRKDETEFKTYFVDDITSSMDDMNVLSFVDIIKYQLYQKDGVMNQIFFSTCDDDLEKLFIHKMKSFGIDWINFNFNSYAKGLIYDSIDRIESFGG